MLGALLAVLTTVVVVVVLRWPSVVAALVVAGLVLPARPGALPARARASPPRARESWRLLVDEALYGWKDLLTTLPPVDGESRLLVLPWLLGLVTGLLGTVLSLVRTRRPLARRAAAAARRPWRCSRWSSCSASAGPSRCGCRASVFAVLALAWLGLRYARASAPVKSTQGKLVRLGTGCGAGRASPGCWPCRSAPGRPAATRAGSSCAPRSTRRSTWGSTPRRWRPSAATSSCREGKKSPLNLHDTTLFTIEGVPAGSRVRLAVLDRYDGVVWGASNNAQPGVVDDTYQRVSSVIDNPVEGTGASTRG